MKPVIELVAAGTAKIVAYACGECGTVAATRAKAEECHTPRVCSKCGTPRLRYSSDICNACLKIASDERAQRRYDKAKKITEAEWNANSTSDYVWHDDEGFTDGIEGVRERCLDKWDGNDEDDIFPHYVEACIDRSWRIVAEQIIDAEIEAIEIEDADELRPSDEAVAELQVSLDAWTAKHPVKWYESSGVLIILDEEENAKALAEYKAGTFEPGPLGGTEVILPAPLDSCERKVDVSPCSVCRDNPNACRLCPNDK